MSLFAPVEARFAQAVARLAHCNPFLPERIELERQALGEEAAEAALVWSRDRDWLRERPNLERIRNRAAPLVEQTRERLAAGAVATPAEQELYGDLVLYLLYDRYRLEFRQTLDEGLAAEAPPKVRFWPAFHAEYRRLLAPLGEPPTPEQAAHLFAGCFQVRRAFDHIYRCIIGRSLPAARLRAAVWESCFTADLRRYRRALHARLGDVTTLIAGPSGTGKEIVARAIGHARYIPFDPAAQRFRENFAGAFCAVNLSALSPTLIESELFGHCRGAFTGAVHDRTGWLEACPLLGTVFLDEVGELDAEIQVKLLRVLQTRTFARLGETAPRRFEGKIVAATNRDLGAEMRVGRFREDFYYRLCSDLITTPSLREQLADAPDDLENLLDFVVRQVAGEEALDLVPQTLAWIEQRLGRDYPWPGNFRELEQCVRNVMIRGAYHPPPAAPRSHAGPGPRRDFVRRLLGSELSAEELLRWYCTLVYERTGGYEPAARQLGLDRRTVKAKVDEELLAKLRGEGDE